MFQKLLIPLDGTPESAVALPLARTLARALGASISLLHVAPENASTATEIKASIYLTRIADELDEEVPTEAQVRRGPVGRTVIQAARQRRASAIIMATHARQGFDRAVHGSVADEVLKGCSLPLLLLRPGGKRITRPRNLLVPVDGTPGGSLALQAAVELARALKAKIILVQAVPTLPSAAFVPILGADPRFFDAAMEAEAREGAQRYVEGVAERLRRIGLEAESRAVLGPVPEAITTTAEAFGADLIVMSTHALTGPVRTVLGSVADAVVRTARRPVLLVRRNAELRDETRQAPPASEAPPVGAASKM